jgi:hypothetical protein
MKLVKHAVCALLLIASSAALASETKEFSLLPSDVIGLQNALSSIEVRQRICKDGQNEKPCTETVKIPPGLSVVISANIRALKAAVEDLQYAQHKIIGAASGGSGYVEKGSRQEAEVNFQSVELARLPIKLKLTTISVKELDDAKLDLSPSVRALLDPILEDAR